MHAVMCIYEVCIVRFYVLIRVRMYVFMHIFCCVFKTVYRVGLLYVFQRHVY